MLTNMYYSEGGLWTREADEATNFQTTVSALRTIERNRMSDVEVVLKFDDSTYDVRLPTLKRNPSDRPPNT